VLTKSAYFEKYQLHQAQNFEMDAWMAGWYGEQVNM